MFLVVIQKPENYKKHFQFAIKMFQLKLKIVKSTFVFVDRSGHQSARPTDQSDPVSHLEVVQMRHRLIFTSQNRLIFTSQDRFFYIKQVDDPPNSKTKLLTTRQRCVKIKIKTFYIFSSISGPKNKIEKVNLDKFVPVSRVTDILNCCCFK